MKKLLLLILLLPAGSLHAQQRQIAVRLFSTQQLTSIRVVPEGNATVAGTALKGATTVSLKGAALVLDAARTTSATVRITGSFRIETASNPPAHLAQPLDISVDGLRLRILIHPGLEDYVAAVLAGEAGSFRSPESLKAMAVAIRTFAVRFEGRHGLEGFDFCDTTHCQDFRIASTIPDRLRSAVEATEGELLWFNGTPAATYYHQDCGGRTEDASSVWTDVRAPYLRAQEDPFCVATGRKDWATELTVEELRRVTGSTNIEITGRTPSGRVRQVRLSGGKTATLTAEQFRLSLGRDLGWNRIRSDDYEIRRIADRFRFEGHGAGHGVGLCQAGAARMGESGRNYREILAFYYPGTKLGLTAQGLSWSRRSGERIDLETTRGEVDRNALSVADRLARRIEAETGWQFRSRPLIRIFPSVATFRDSTGEPGWIAASTKAAMIRLQPIETLGTSLESTLRHELLHLLIEQRATAGLPYWFREGLVLALAEPSSTRVTGRSPSEIERDLLYARSREELSKAYADAKAIVAELIARRGRQVILGWVSSGLPPSLDLTKR